MKIIIFKLCEYEWMNTNPQTDKWLSYKCYKSMHCSEDDSATIADAMETVPLCNQSLSNCPVAEEGTWV